MNKNAVVLVVVAVAIVLSVWAVLRPATKEVVVREVNNLGATPTLDGIDNPFASIGGFKTYWVSNVIGSTSSIPCFVRNPFNATSTILRAALTINSNNLGAANTFDLSTSSSASNGYGSSSPALVRAYSVASGEKASIIWQPNSTSTYDGAGVNILAGAKSDGSSNYIVKPGEYVTWRIATATPSVFSSYLTGTCSMLWQQIQ